jgi:hypothetical protein
MWCAGPNYRQVCPQVDPCSGAGPVFRCSGSVLQTLPVLTSYCQGESTFVLQDVKLLNVTYHCLPCCHVSPLCSLLCSLSCSLSCSHVCHSCRNTPLCSHSDYELLLLLLCMLICAAADVCYSCRHTPHTAVPVDLHRLVSTAAHFCCGMRLV